jgi:hypothetical protein
MKIEYLIKNSNHETIAEKIDSELVSITLNNVVLSLSELRQIYGNIKFYYFIKNNYDKISEIEFNSYPISATIKLKLKNGFLHSTTEPSIQYFIDSEPIKSFLKIDKLSEPYYINGYLCSTEQWNLQVRKNKIENIIQKISSKKFV